MAIIGSTPTVSVSVPVPVPAQTKPKAPRQPVSFGLDDDADQPTLPTAPKPQRQLRAVLLPWSPPPRQMKRLPKKRIKFMRKEVDHEPFHAKIAENPDEHTSSLAYADFLEENEMPVLAAFIREVVRTKQNDMHEYRLGRKANIFNIETGPASRQAIPQQPNTIYRYKGFGEFREPVRDRIGRVRSKPAKTTQLSIHSPNPNDPTAYITHSLDESPDKINEWQKKLIEEGHPVGN